MPRIFMIRWIRRPACPCIIIYRLRYFMRRKFIAFVILVALVVTLGGCDGCALFSGCSCSACNNKGPKVQTFGNVTNGIYYYADRHLQDVFITEFDESRYDADEFARYLSEDIEAYNAEHTYICPVYLDEDGNQVPTNTLTKCITIERCTSKNNELTMRLLYGTVQDYLNYNAEEIQKRGGSVLQNGVLTADSTELLQLSYIDTEGNPVDFNELISARRAPEYRYVTCDFEAVLYGEGDIIGFTQNGSYDPKGNCVNVPGGQRVTVIFAGADE